MALLLTTLAYLRQIKVKESQKDQLLFSFSFTQITIFHRPEAGATEMKSISALPALLPMHGPKAQQGRVCASPLPALKSDSTKPLQ